jgi:hypothetical protein
MSTNALCGAALGAVLMLIVQANPAAALEAVTYVSSLGSDASPCTRTAPCKTVQAAYFATAADGEIFTLSPGPYGHVTINKSITITGIPGASLGDVYINAAPTDIVVLSGLHFEPTVNGGVRMVAGGKLLVDDCLIDSNGNYGISIDPSTNTTTVVSNCRITNNQVGVRITPGVGKTTAVTLNNVQIDHSTDHGLYVSGSSKTSVILNSSTLVYNQNTIYAGPNTKVFTLGNNLIIGSTIGAALVPLALK